MKKTLAAIITIIILLSQALPLAWAWQIERPYRDMDIHDLVENSNTNNEASVGLGVWVDDYDENAGLYGADYVEMNVSMTANSRMGITYQASWEDLWWFDEENGYVVDYYNEYSNVGSHWGAWVDFPPYLTFRFWGGHNSAEYKRVWVSSNGFVCFDLSESTTHVPKDIPSTASPNALIAGVWTGLIVDLYAKITTYRVSSGLFSAFAITWENVLTADQKRLTFQIVLENAPSEYVAPYYPQSRIWINYKSVSSIYDDFTYGIEDHEGLRGYGGLKSGSELVVFNQGTMYLQQISNGFIKRLKLEFEDPHPQTRFNIVEDPTYDTIRGKNLRFDPELPPPEPDSYKIFRNTLGTGNLLLGAGGVILGVGTFPITFPVGFILVTMAWRDYLAESYYSSIEKLELVDTGTDRAYITVPAQDYVVDTALGLVFHWILDTENSVGHSLTIMAKVEYCEQSVDGTIIDKDLTTSVTLNINPDDNDSFDDADTIQAGSYSWLYLDYGFDQVDYYKISVTPGKTLFVKMYARDLDYDLYLYNQNQELVDKSELGTGITESVVGKGECYIKVNASSGGWGWYSLEVEEVEDLYDGDFLEGWSCSGGTLFTGGGKATILIWTSPAVMTKSWTFNSEVLKFATVKCCDYWDADSWRFEARRASDGMWFYGSNSTSAETKTWVITDWYTGEIDKVRIKVFGEDGEDQASFDYISITSAVTLTITTGFGGTTDPAPGTHEYLEKTSVQVTAIPDPDYSLMYWRLDGQRVYSNPITVTTDSDHTLKAYFSGGGGCPTLFVWNGSDYVDYGVINIHDVENDVVREVPVQAEDVSVAGYKVKFRLREGWEGLNYSHSLIDQVKLYAVDNEGNRLLCPLIKAEHSDQGKVLLKLLFSDDYRTDTYLMNTIDLTFIMPYPAETIENFTFTIEGHNPHKT